MDEHVYRAGLLIASHNAKEGLTIAGTILKKTEGQDT